MSHSAFVSRASRAGIAAALALAAFLPGVVAAQASRPIQAINGATDSVTFTHEIIDIGLRRLGYEPKPDLRTSIPASYLALSKGEADYTGMFWTPMFNEQYDKLGADANFRKVGPMFENIVQGYLIDKATADKYHITNLQQLSDPKVAKLFDTDGDGKANLTGCDAGWGCEKIINHQLDAYKLRGTVTVDSGSYFALMASTIARFKKGQPVFYWAWRPSWVNQVLVHGRDVVFLTVPFTSLPPGSGNIPTVLSDGRNLGTGINTNWVLLNRKFADANPVAVKFVSQVRIPVEDIEAQLLKAQQGEKSPEDLKRHAQQWVAAHQAEFDHWVQEAAKAK